MSDPAISAVWMGRSPSQVTADVVSAFGSLDAPGAVEELTRQLQNYQRMDATLARGELSRTAADPRRSAGDEPDSMDREARLRMDFAAAVGRPPYPWEIAGPPKPGCVACRRLSGAACEEHTRRPGVDPIARPPREQWVDRSPYPGHMPIPYNVLNSVA